MDVPLNVGIAVKSQHFWIHVFLLFLTLFTCTISNLEVSCPWLDLPVWYVIQYHDIGCFFAVELGIFILWIVGDPLDKTMSYCFDFVGTTICFIIGILQIIGKWMTISGFETPKNCRIRLLGVLNLFASIVYLADVVLLLKNK